MYLHLIGLLFTAAYFIVIFLAKKSYFLRVKNRLRRFSFFHTKVFKYLRLYFRILLPHAWSTLAYKASNWKRYPWFYSMLNGLQFAFIFGGAILFMNETASNVKLDYVEQGMFSTTDARFESFRAGYRNKVNRHFPSKLVLSTGEHSDLSFVFNLHLEAIPNVMDKFKSLKPDQNVEVRYFTVLGRDYLVGMSVNDVVLLSTKQAIQAYRYREGGKDSISYLNEVILLLAVFLALIKYKIYGLRNYFKRIDK